MILKKFSSRMGPVFSVFEHIENPLNCVSNESFLLLFQPKEWRIWKAEKEKSKHSL